MYNYYSLAVQNWCSSEYLIHGLWADINSTSYPTFCTDSPFNLTELKKSTKYENILTSWYDCSYEETLSLYEHEWLKHGTCISQQTGITQNEYFEKTLSLYENNKDGANNVCFDLDFIVIQCI